MTPEEALEYLYLQSHRHLAYAFSDNPHADKCKSIIEEALAERDELKAEVERLENLIIEMGERD